VSNAALRLVTENEHNNDGEIKLHIGRNAITWYCLEQ
jgi:hypothetical protein